MYCYQCLLGLDLDCWFPILQDFINSVEVCILLLIWINKISVWFLIYLIIHLSASLVPFSRCPWRSKTWCLGQFFELVGLFNSCNYFVLMSTSILLSELKFLLELLCFVVLENCKSQTCFLWLTIWVYVVSDNQPCFFVCVFCASVIYKDNRHYVLFPPFGQEWCLLDAFTNNFWCLSCFFIGWVWCTRFI